MDTNKSIIDVTRAQWGARVIPQKNYKPDLQYHRAVVHHTWRPTAGQWRGNVTMQGMQNYHIDTEGWLDIGPHLFIAPDGKVFEGRPLGTLGAHCGGKLPARQKRVFDNPGSIGIEVVGDYDREIPSPSLVLKVQFVIDWLRAKYGFTEVRGHWECWGPIPPKTCPGKNLAEALGMGDRWRQAFPKG